MSKTTDLIIALPVICKAENAQRFSKDNYLQIRHEIDNPNSVFARQNGETIENRLMTGFTWKMYVPIEFKLLADYGHKLAIHAVRTIEGDFIDKEPSESVLYEMRNELLDDENTKPLVGLIDGIMTPAEASTQSFWAP